MIKIGDIIIASYNNDKDTDAYIVTYDNEEKKYCLRCLICGDKYFTCTDNQLQNIKKVLKIDKIKIIKQKEFVDLLNKTYNPKYKLKEHKSIYEVN